MGLMALLTELRGDGNTAEEYPPSGKGFGNPSFSRLCVSSVGPADCEVLRCLRCILLVDMGVSGSVEADPAYDPGITVARQA